MKKKNFGDKSEKREKRIKIKPGADSRLRPIFSKIGQPGEKEFIPDEFQIKAVKVAGESDCLVTAPTGAGKTWIAKTAIEKIFFAGGKSWYASPLKALSNSKHLEFGEIFGQENVGILTGDRKENPDAPIIIGTTEILRNHLYDAMHLGVSLPVDFVVLDEAHFLGDEDRGVVWEEIFIYLPARIPVLLLSATIGNAHEIAQWLSSIRSKKCIVIEEEKRPVPLFPLFFHPSGTLFPLVSKIAGKQKTSIDKKLLNFIANLPSASLSRPNRLPPFGDILRVLRKYRLLPAIFFLKSRSDCDRALEYCRENIFTSPEHKDRLLKRINELVVKSPHITHHKQIKFLENFAVGSHHSGQLPAWKLVLEKLMTEGLLDAIFATSTVAAGVNFPARSIVMSSSDRFNGHEFLPLDPTEFHQMTGRAGRRGMDNIGFALVLPGKFMDIKHIAKLIGMPASDVNSQIKINFSMVLNLLLSHSPDQIEYLLSKSFAAFQIHGASLSYIHLVKNFNRHLDFLKENGFVDKDGKLTEDGFWASKLRVDQPLLIAEAIRKNIFNKFNPALLAAAVSVFINEEENDFRIDRVYIPNNLFKAYKRIKNQLKPFQDILIKEGFEARTLYLRPMATIHAWVNGYSWDKIIDIAELEAGNLVMLILRTADNLRQLAGLREFFPDIAETAEKAVLSILRDPVVFED